MGTTFNLPVGSMNSHACREMTRRYAENTQVEQGLPALMTLRVSNAFIEWGGPRTKYRPRIAMQGKPERFEGEFPAGIRVCRIPEADDYPTLTYFYEFTRANLAELAAKGIFEDGFSVPQVLRQNTLELPCLCDMTVIQLPPEEGDDGPVAQPPMAFIRVQDGSRPDEPNTLTCYDKDAEINGRFVPGAGYNIAEYFEFMPVGGYEVKASPQAMDDLEDMVESVRETGVSKKPPKEMDTISGHVADLTEDRIHGPGYRAGIEEPAPAPEEVMPDPSQMTDPELRALYVRMRKEAMDAYDRNKARKQATLAAVAAEAMGDKPADDIAGDERPVKPEPEAKPAQPKPEQEPGDAAKRYQTTTRNQAENIDTPEEFLEEGGDLHPRDAAVVDLKGEDVAREAASRNRPVPDTSELIPDIADGLDEEFGQ